MQLLPFAVLLSDTSTERVVIAIYSQCVIITPKSFDN